MAVADSAALICDTGALLDYLVKSAPDHQQLPSDGIVVARATSELDPPIQALAAWRRALTAAGDSPKQEDAASFCAGLAYGLAFAGR